MNEEIHTPERLMGYFNLSSLILNTHMDKNSIHYNIKKRILEHLTKICSEPNVFPNNMVISGIRIPKVIDNKGNFWFWSKRDEMYVEFDNMLDRMVKLIPSIFPTAGKVHQILHQNIFNTVAVTKDDIGGVSLTGDGQCNSGILAKLNCVLVFVLVHGRIGGGSMDTLDGAIQEEYITPESLGSNGNIFSILNIVSAGACNYTTSKFVNSMIKKICVELNLVGNMFTEADEIPLTIQHILEEPLKKEEDKIRRKKDNGDYDNKSLEYKEDLKDFIESEKNTFSLFNNNVLTQSEDISLLNQKLYSRLDKTAMQVVAFDGNNRYVIVGKDSVKEQGILSPPLPKGQEIELEIASGIVPDGTNNPIPQGRKVEYFFLPHLLETINNNFDGKNVIIVDFSCNPYSEGLDKQRQESVAAQSKIAAVKAIDDLTRSKVKPVLHGMLDDAIGFSGGGNLANSEEEFDLIIRNMPEEVEAEKNIEVFSKIINSLC